MEYILKAHTLVLKMLTAANASPQEKLESKMSLYESYKYVFI